MMLTLKFIVKITPCNITLIQVGIVVRQHYTMQGIVSKANLFAVLSSSEVFFLLIRNISKLG